ncbi:MAG: NUDIX domain-containing protein [Bacteroidales bacterium]|nr:NUDIX domain-containing protein [Bacteroidales bacterium]
MKDENVLCVPTNTMKSVFDLSKSAWIVTPAELNQLPMTFVKRLNAETDSSYKQIIAYALVFNEKGELLCYCRHGSEKRLIGLRSAGIGGHVNDNDLGVTMFETLQNGLIREIQEELNVCLSSEQINLLGMINEEKTEVGHCHTGVVFKIELTSDLLHFDDEINNPLWCNPEDIDLTQFELWSGLAIQLTINKKYLYYE